MRMKSFWEHSLACGIAARVLARYQGEKNSESYFVAGFLHDVGRLILLENRAEQYAQVYEIVQADARLADEVEKEVFGFTHADVGKEVVKFWNLPSPLVEAIAHHHEPTTSRSCPRLTATTHVADVMIHTFQIGFSGNPLVPPLDPDAWKMSGLDVAILKPASSEIFQQHREALNVLLD